MAKVIQAFVIDNATKREVVFDTLQNALEYVSGNFHALTIVYYDNNYNEHNYNAEFCRC